MAAGLLVFGKYEIMIVSTIPSISLSFYVFLWRFLSFSTIPGFFRYGRILEVMEQLLTEGSSLTPDLGGSASTSACGDAFAARLRQGNWPAREQEEYNGSDCYELRGRIPAAP